ncbi:MAG: hypothetical protein OEU26_27275 [Candidatus Tectomicrobia bacterium]|nr:hypothetical protein [Candidatus Tectomicrobia bacterium]
MPGRPFGSITQGSVLEKTDNTVNHRDASGAFDLRGPFLTALQDLSQSYLDVMDDHVHLTTEEISYLREYWYDTGYTFWPDHYPTEPIVRQGTIKAIEVATEQNVPMRSYWMTVGDRFEMLVASSDEQVTRIMLTPPVPATAPAHRNRARIWVVQHGIGEVENHLDLNYAVIDTIRLGP